MQNHLNNEEGFTLIELLISMVITVMILTALFNLMLNSSNTFHKQNNEVYNQQHVRDVITKISKYVMEGTTTKVYSSSDFGIDGKYRITLEADKIIRVTQYPSGNKEPISTEVAAFNVINIVEGRTIKVTIVDKNNKYYLDTILTPRNY